MRKMLLVGISSFALGLGAAGAIAYADQQGKSAHPDTYKMLELFGDVLTTVDQQYVVPVDNKKLIEAALDGMVTSLDPHSGYLNPDDYDDMRDQTRGEYGGLGLQVSAEDGAVKIISPMDGTPASRAHLQPGDYITAIDGASIIGLSLNDAVKQMRGTDRQSRHPDHRSRQDRPFHGQADPRGDRHQVGDPPPDRRLRLPAPVRFRREDRATGGAGDQGHGDPGPAHEGAGAGSA